MGYDIQRFTGEVDEELICPICTHVLEEPLQVCNGEAVVMNAWSSELIVLQSIFLFKAPQCEHAFCQACINEWLTRQATCPVDRTAIVATQLKPVPRILRNLLYRFPTIKNTFLKCPITIYKF